MVIVDDYNRWTWVKFLRSKDCAYDVFSSFCTQIQSEKEMKILKVRSDHGGEFENEPFETFCVKHGIVHEFSSPRTPQQNGVVERKNRPLQEMARTMIHEDNLAKHFWAEAVNTYVISKIESISDLSWRKQHMNSSKEEDPISLTFINMGVFVTL